MKKKIIVAIVALVLVVSIGTAFGVNYIYSNILPITPISPPALALTLYDNGVATNSPIIGDTVTLSATLNNSANGVSVGFYSSSTGNTGTFSTLIGTSTTVNGVANLTAVMGSNNLWIEAQCPS
jgi:hypothetical protein